MQRRQEKAQGLGKTSDRAGILVCDEEWLEMKTAPVSAL